MGRVADCLARCWHGSRAVAGRRPCSALPAGPKSRWLVAMVWPWVARRIEVRPVASVDAVRAVGQFAIAFFMDHFVLTVEFILGCDIADGRVQSDAVVVGHVFGDDSFRLVEGKRHTHSDAFPFESFVPTFDLAVGLRIVGRSLDVGHAGDADEFLELSGDELWSVVADDAGRGIGKGFTGSLENGLHVVFLHFFADFPVYDEATGPVEDAAEEVKGAGNVEVTDVDVPVFVRHQRLHEARTLLRGRGR